MVIQHPPAGVRIRSDVEYLSDRPSPFRARVRWTDPQTGKVRSLSSSAPDRGSADAWIDKMVRAAGAGLSPDVATMTLANYGDLNMKLALRGLEAKTTDPYLAGWRKRVIPSIGHLPVTMISNGLVDRAVHGWISDDCSKSTVKNSIAVLVRVMEQAYRDGIIDRNPARITGWQREYSLAEDELDDPRSLALPDWRTLSRLADAITASSHNEYQGWGEVVMFAACTAARIGEVSGCRVKDIDTKDWVWTVRRQTTPSPGGLIDKNTKGKRSRKVPIIPEIQELVLRRISNTNGEGEDRLFTGPRGGRITTAILRDATDWDAVVTSLGFEHLRRHDLRHTGLTWMADAGIPVHHLQRIAGHGQLTTTQRYLHPNSKSVTGAGLLLSKHLAVVPDVADVS